MNIVIVTEFASYVRLAEMGWHLIHQDYRGWTMEAPRL